MYLALKYALFALAATVVNILVQDLALQVPLPGYTLAFSMGCGTVAGLVAKYVLDKKYIFSCRTRSIAEDGMKFFVYSLMGVVTTLIFWGTELSFEFIFQNKTMRYTGAVIGLSVGYWIKYHLDKRFVFGEAG